MGAASSKLDSINSSATVQTRLPGTSIHRSLPAVIAVDAFKVTEITERCAPNADADLEHVHKAFADFFKLFAVEPACRCLGCNARCEEAFIGIDISGSCH